MIRNDDLTRRLTALAEGTAPPPRQGLAGEVAQLHRTRRRQHAGVAAAAAAVLVVVVTVPMLLSGRDRNAGPAAPSSATESWSVSNLPPADVLGGPTRGSLAGDAAFVEAVRQLPWTGPDDAAAAIPDAPLDTRHVVFAGDTAAGRWSLVAGRNTARPQPPNDDPEQQTDLGALSQVAVVWFVGPPGATPDQMAPVSVPRGVDATVPAALLDATGGALVVVVAPGDTLELSTHPDVAADTTITRQWFPVDVVNGLAVVDLGDEGPSSASLGYRVTRNGVTYETGPDGFQPPGATGEQTPSIVAARPVLPDHDATVRRVALDVLAWTGLPAEQVAFTALWSGEIPAPGPNPARVDVLAAELPSRAVYLGVTLWLPMADGSSAGTVCGTGFQPAGPPVAARTVVTVCDATDFTGNSETLSSLVVVGPHSAVSARALDADGTVLAEFVLADGIAVVPTPVGTATVETLDPTGDVLGRESPLGFTTGGR